MEWQKFIVDIYVRISQALGQALGGLTVDDLNQRPRPDCNSMGWLAWHLTRNQDRAIAELTGEEQLWVKDHWHTKFNRPPEPTDTGFGHSSEDVAAFKSPDSRTLLEYHNAVLERSKRYISQLSEADLKRKLNHPVFPTVSARLISVISDNLQHAGQIAYVRGLLKGKGWSTI